MNLSLNFSEKTPLQQLFIYLGISLTSLFFFAAVSVSLLPKIADPFTLQLLFSTLQQVFVFMLPALFWGYYYSERPVRQNLYLRYRFKKTDLYTLILLLLSFPAIHTLGGINLYLVQQLPQNLQTYLQAQEEMAFNVYKILFADSSLYHSCLLVLLLALLPAVAEELTFRGVLQTLLLRCSKGRRWRTIVITAFIFSFLHFQFLGFLPRLAMGIVLGYVFFYKGSLVPSMIFHFLFNGIQVIAIRFQGIETLKTFDKQTDDFSYYVGLLAVAGLILIIRYMEKKSSLQQHPL